VAGVFQGGACIISAKKLSVLSVISLSLNAKKTHTSARIINDLEILGGVEGVFGSVGQFAWAARVGSGFD